MQDRVETACPPRLVPDSLEYRIVRAKLRAHAGSPEEAVAYFRTAARGQDRRAPARGRLRPRPRAAPRARFRRRVEDARAAARGPLPSGLRAARRPAPHRHGQARRGARGLSRRRCKTYPEHRALAYAYLDLLLQMGRAQGRARRPRGAPAHRARTTRASTSCRRAPSRPRASRSRSTARRPRRTIAAATSAPRSSSSRSRSRSKGSNFYESSSAESRLREMRALLENERAAEKALKIS